MYEYPAPKVAVSEKVAMQIWALQNKLRDEKGMRADPDRIADLEYDLSDLVLDTLLAQTHKPAERSELRRCRQAGGRPWNDKLFKTRFTVNPYL